MLHWWLKVNDEIASLEKAKHTTEMELEAHIHPLNIALECLTLRERRREADLVKDKAEVKLSLSYHGLNIVCIYLCLYLLSQDVRQRHLVG